MRKAVVFWVRKMGWLPVALMLAGLAVACSGPPTAGPATPTAFQLQALTAATDTDPTAPDLPATPSPTSPEPAQTPLPTVPGSASELPGAQLPPGFSILKFAELDRPTALAFDPMGRMLAASLDGRIYLLEDLDSDGHAETSRLFASGFPTPLGVAVHPENGEVFISYQGAIARLRDRDGDGSADESADLFAGLPFGRHQNNNLKFGPDGWLYMGVGSTCDVCFEADARSATIMRFQVETLQTEVVATGLRNPFDLAFHPRTGDLFATENGRDDLGMEAPLEELNRIVPGGNYGFPGCWDGHDQSGCAESQAPLAFFESHSSANGIDFNRAGPFPPLYHGDAFVAIFGSFLKPGVQTGIQRVVLAREGESIIAEPEWFARFPPGVMPLPLVFGPDGALYVGDHTGDAVYRISYGLPEARR